MKEQKVVLWGKPPDFEVIIVRSPDSRYNSIGLAVQAAEGKQVVMAWEYERVIVTQLALENTYHQCCKIQVFFFFLPVVYIQIPPCRPAELALVNNSIQAMIHQSTERFCVLTSRQRRISSAVGATTTKIEALLRQRHVSFDCLFHKRKGVAETDKTRHRKKEK